MRRVLFVDDERKVLDGLRRMLYGLRREWQMDFADGGPQALERLAAAPYDVVVTDMRMPGMDGSELLRQVMLHYPATLRIILSGQCDRHTVLKAVEPTHQFLTKPCDPDTLKSTLLRACQRRDQLTDDRYKRLVSQMISVPSLPSRHDALLAELQSSEPSLIRVSEIIGQDMGMAAKIMQLVSTSFFGTPQPLVHPARAASLFDLETLRALALSTEVFSRLAPTDPAVPQLERLYGHCVDTAVAAREIAWAECRDAGLADQAYLAGLLHDIGLIVIYHYVPDQLAAILAAARGDAIGIYRAEERLGGQTHAHIGAYLIALWGLPDAVIQAVAFHHAPIRSESRGFTPLTAVHVAGGLDEQHLTGDAGPATPIDSAYLERIGLADRLPRWREICAAVRAESAA
jgi:HD-like signal output (HDOD) protein/CheY-like chemotaxis protein